MNLEAFAKQVALADPLLIVDRTVFVHALPADVSTGAMLRLYFGGTDIDHYLPGYRKGTFQVIVRAPVYKTAKALMDKVVISLTRQTDAFDEMQINYIRPRSEPFLYPLSAGNRWEFATNFDACYVLPGY
jgi:hypothetical protein